MNDELQGALTTLIYVVIGVIVILAGLRCCSASLEDSQ